MLAVTCLTCSVQLARPQDEEAQDTRSVRAFLARHADAECVAVVDLAALRSSLQPQGQRA